MSIRRAHMATYPDRQGILELALRSLQTQVDEIHLVLNEYREIPAFLAKIRNLHPVLAKEDYKDVGKFACAPAANDRVFLVDDDLVYVRSYCDFIEELSSDIGLESCVFGIHGSIYCARDVLNPRGRKLFRFNQALRVSTYVDQLGTGTVFALGKNLAPLSYMSTAKKFVDIRYAKWCFEQGIDQIALSRPLRMVRSVHHGGNTIYRSFTRLSADQLSTEIKTYAGRSPKVGQHVGPRLSLFRLFRAA
jgi:hypothetical protein